MRHLCIATLILLVTAGSGFAQPPASPVSVSGLPLTEDNLNPLVVLSPYVPLQWDRQPGDEGYFVFLWEEIPQGSGEVFSVYSGTPVASCTLSSAEIDTLEAWNAQEEPLHYAFCALYLPKRDTTYKVSVWTTFGGLINTPVGSGWIKRQGNPDLKDSLAPPPGFDPEDEVVNSVDLTWFTLNFGQCVFAGLFFQPCPSP